MIIVRDLNRKTETKYNDVDDALWDIVTDEMIDDFIDNIYYEPIKVVGFEFTVSKVLRNCLSEQSWSDFESDLINDEAVYIADELEYAGEFDYWGYRFIKVDEEKE